MTSSRDDRVNLWVTRRTANGAKEAARMLEEELRKTTGTRVTITMGAAVERIVLNWLAENKVKKE